MRPAVQRAARSALAASTWRAGCARALPHCRHRRPPQFASTFPSPVGAHAAPLSMEAQRSPWGSSTKHLTVVDAHCGGEPARVVVGGVPPIPGASVREQRENFMDKLDHYRTLLLTEPRGYPCQNANVIVPPSHPDAAYGFIILEQNKIYPAMSGHNCICVATVLLETGMVPMTEPVTRFQLEAPVGLVEIEAECAEGKVLSVKLHNAPSFVGALDVPVDVPELGTVNVDIVFGGMWYAIVDAEAVGLELTSAHGKDICRLGEMIKVAARSQHPVAHPLMDYSGPDILCFRGPPTARSGAHGKNAVVMSNGDLDWERPETWTGMIDRSPCGTGTTAVMTQMWARGELQVHEEFVHESILGSKFVGRLEEETTVGENAAVLATIAGRAWVTQYCQVVCDPTDIFPVGYTVGDIWTS